MTDNEFPNPAVEEGLMLCASGFVAGEIMSAVDGKARLSPELLSGNTATLF